VSDNGEFMVIRPLAYVPEKDLIRWAEVKQFPIIPCTLCGSQENLQRKQVGNLLRDWDTRFPGRLENMLSALQHVVPSHLMDRKLFPFEGLTVTGEASEDGDKAFDGDELPPPTPRVEAEVPPGAPAAVAPTGNSQRPRPVITIGVG
jgi:tRNA 2-thiocytidine biosynthesis protein TtcA